VSLPPPGHDPTLRALEDADAEALYALIDRDREQLSPWLPWAAEQALSNTRDFIAAAHRQEDEGNGFQVALLHDGAIAGVVGFHAVSWAHRSASLGYWLAADRQGRGLMTTAVRRLVDHAIFEWALHRIEIRAAVGNRRSRAIPERLGFVQEGVLRQAELVQGRYLDLVVYSMLAPDWPAAGAPAPG
jgi:ribosomal-protein-serine acetyltransferase